MERKRCRWCCGNRMMEKYHDEEWGTPLHDDQKQFEFLMMEVMQCGLNWNMMLKKREIFRRCFDGFDYRRIALYEESDIQRILETEGMIRSAAKIRAVISNARCFLKITDEFGSFDRYLWGFTGGKTYIYKSHQLGQGTASNELSETISRDLKKRGFKYLGPVTVYSHLQACGIINDHEAGCWKYKADIAASDVEFRD